MFLDMVNFLKTHVEKTYKNKSTKAFSVSLHIKIINTPIKSWTVNVQIFENDPYFFRKIWIILT